MKTKMLKLAKFTSLGTTVLSFLPLITIAATSCSPTNPQTKTIGLIDGTDWTGRNAGSFIPDDYTIDYDHLVVTYQSAISIHSYNLVIPNYVTIGGDDNVLFKVDIGPRCFANNNGIAGTVEFNDFILSIPEYCFYNCPSLTGLVFHTYPLSFNVGACGNCPLLSQIFVLHDGTIYHDWASQTIFIGDYAFFNCILSGELVFGPALQYLGQSAFENCIGITSADFRLCQNLNYISVSAFGSCPILEDVYLSKSITDIQEKAFRDCSFLKTIYIPEENMPISIGANAFYNCNNFENFSKTPHIIKLEPGAFALDTNIKIWLWEPKYNLEKIPPYTYSSCNFSALKFWKDGPNVQDYAFANNNNLAILDFTDFVVTESDDPKQIGKVIVPDWEGEHIFSSANLHGGTIYLPSNGVLDDKWIAFFAKNDIRLSSEPSQPEKVGGWKVKFGAPRVDYIVESEEKTADVSILPSENEVVVTFSGFQYTTIGDVSDEDVEKNMRVTYHPFYLDDKGKKVRYEPPISVEILWNKTKTFDLKLTISLEELREDKTIFGPIKFFYRQNQISSLYSDYTINLSFQQ